MRWRYMFSNSLSKGVAYYNSGKVKSLAIDGLKFHATVQGGRLYNVDVEIKSQYDLACSCTCPVGMKGCKCKHMAAAMLEAETREFFDDVRVNKLLNEKYRRNRFEQRETPRYERIIEKPFNPFTKTKLDTDYHFFDLSVITGDVRFSEVDYDAALKLVKSGEVTLTSFKLSYVKGDGSPSDKPIAKVTGEVVRDGHRYAVGLVFSSEKVLNMQCGVPGFYYGYSSKNIYQRLSESPTPNKYLTALFVMVDRYIKENNPGDATDATSSRLLESFKPTKGALVPLEEEDEKTDAKVDLEPRVELSESGFKVSFKVGKGKMYVVRKVPELVDAVEHKKKFSLGTKNQLDFAIDELSDQAKELYDFILPVVEDYKHQEAEQAKNYYYGYREPDMGADVSLYGRRLDIFMETLGKNDFEFTDRTKVDSPKSKAKLVDKDMQLNFVVAPTYDRNQDFDGITVTAQVPKFVCGNRYAYYAENGNVCRMSREKANSLVPLCQNAEDGELHLRFGRQRINDFYHYMLPKLKDCVQVIEEKPEEIEKYLTPEAKFLFYLDYRNEKIYCAALVRYGEEQYNLVEAMDGTKLTSGRDNEREEQVTRLLAYYFKNTDLEEKCFVLSEDAETWNFLRNGIKQFMDVGEVKCTEAFNRLKNRRKVKLEMGVSLQSNLMNLSVISEDVTPLELLEILQSYRLKRKFHRLHSGEFISMDDDNIQRLSEMLESLNIPLKDFVAGKMHIPAYRALYLDKVLEKNADMYTSRDSNFRNLIKEFKTIGESDFQVPENLRKTMRNYQVLGHKWLRTLAHYGFGGILADDMGLGKTLQAISCILADKNEGKTGASLIVCPASLVYNWQEEFTRFAPDLKVQLVVGTKGERKSKLLAAVEADVLVTSYDLLKNDVVNYASLNFNWMFIDEAQKIKNHSTVTAKAVKTIHAAYKFALTGTPIENRLSELWSIFDFIMPAFLYTYDEFKHNFEIPIVQNDNKEAYARLRQMVGPFILRRMKSDVLQELPEKLEEVRMARFGDIQQKVYDGEVVKALKMLKEKTPERLKKDKIQVLAELTRLRQLCCDPSLVFSDYNGGSAKRELCLEMVESAIEGGHKILIFSQFKSVLELLQGDLVKKGIPYYLLTGDTPKEERVKMVHAFNENDIPVFLISLKAGGTGLNLTGADIVIHYDPWWNLAAQNQATDRAHRIGQDKVVSVYKLIAKGSIEEKILHLQEAKSNLAESVLAEAGQKTLGTMTAEELMDLL